MTLLIGRIRRLNWKKTGALTLASIVVILAGFVVKLYVPISWEMWLTMAAIIIGIMSGISALPRAPHDDDNLRKIMACLEDAGIDGCSMNEIQDATLMKRITIQPYLIYLERSKTVTKTFRDTGRGQRAIYVLSRFCGITS